MRCKITALFILLTLLGACGNNEGTPPDVFNKKPSGPNIEPIVIEDKFTTRDLFNAITRDDLDEVKKIAESGLNINGHNEEERDIAINKAAREKKWEIVNYLLDNHDPFLKFLDTNNNTPINYALLDGRYLIANKMMKDHDGYISREVEMFTYMLESLQIQGIEFILDHSDLKINDIKTKENLIVTAMREEDQTIGLKLAKTLIQKGYNTQNKANNGKFPFVIAMLEDREDFMDMLVDEFHFKVDLKDDDGKTALYYAILEKKSPADVDYLLGKGADKKLKVDGKKPCKIAKELSKKEHKQERKEIRKSLGCKFLGIF